MWQAASFARHELTDTPDLFFGQLPDEARSMVIAATFRTSFTKLAFKTSFTKAL
jgi:hypothetical protein